MRKHWRKIAVGIVLLIPVVIAYIFIVALPGPEGSYFDSAGTKIHYTDEGAGVPVILVHGFAASGNLNWRMPGIINKLAKNYRVVAMDTRAHGYSDKPHEAGQYGMNMVDDIARLMDHLKIEKAHLVGYSMGGFISLAFAGKYPDRLMSLTQGGSGWYPKGQYPELVQTVPKALAEGRGLEPIVRFMESHNGWFLEQRIPIINFFLCRLNDTEAMMHCFGELEMLQGSEEQLRSKKIPSLAIMGTKDPLRRSAEFMIERNAGAHETHWIGGADHMTTLGNPFYSAEFANTLIEFLGKHTPAVTSVAAN